MILHPVVAMEANPLTKTSFHHIVAAKTTSLDSRASRNTKNKPMGINLCSPSVFAQPMLELF